MARPRALIMATVFAAAAALAATSQSRPLVVSGVAKFTGSGTTWTMTLTNTGTEVIHCMRAFAPSGVSFIRVSGPTGTQSSIVTFSNASLNLGDKPPNNSVTFQLETSDPLSPDTHPVVNVSADCKKDFPAVVMVTVETAPPRDCQKEREAVAAAKARLRAITDEWLDALNRGVGAQIHLSNAEKELSKVKEAVQKEPNAISVINALLKAQTAVEDASEAFRDAKLEAGKLSGLREKAERQLRDAEIRLRGCERAPTRTVADVGSKAADCGAQRVVLAGAQAGSATLAAAVKRFERTRLRPAGKRLHAAIADLERALKAPAARKYRSKVAPALADMRKADAILAGIVRKFDRLAKDAKGAKAKAAKAKAALAKCLAQPSVTISEDDTWTWNAAIGKAYLCVNVRTKPAQASISATLTGPGFSASVSRAQLHADGSAQIRGQITQPGSYTKGLVVYDASGKQTATAAKTFTVAPSPQDGPAANPACPKPTS